MGSYILAGFIKRFATARYAIALLAVAAAAGVRLTLEPVLGNNTPFLTFFAAVVVARRLSGRGPALAATVLSVLTVWYLFLEPRYSFALANPYAPIELGLFFLIGMAISVLETTAGLRSGGAGDRPAWESASPAGRPLLRRIAMLSGAAVAMGVLASMLWTEFQRSEEAQGGVEHSYQVLNAAASLRSSLDSAEASQRGYLLTGDPQFFESYRFAVASGRQASATLRRLTSDNPVQQDRLAEFDRLAQSRLSLLDAAIEAGRRGGLAAAIAQVRAGGGKQLMDRLQALLYAVDEEEHRLLYRQSAAVAAAGSRTRWILGLGSGSLVLLLILAGANIERHIHARNQVERALARQARLIDLSHDAIITADGNRVITGWNEGAHEMYGWTAKEAIGKTIHQLLHTESFVPLAELNGILAREERWEGELTHTRFGGRRIVVESCQVLQRDEAGQPAGYLEINRDITERKRTQEALRESEARLRSLGDNLPEAAIYTYRLDAEGRPHVDFISAGIERLTGVPAAEYINDASTVEQSIVPEDRDSLNAAMARSHATQARFEAEIRHQHRLTGEIRWSILRSTPTRHPDGSTTWDGIELDITDRKLVEEELRRSEAILRSMFDSPGVMRGMVEVVDGSIVHLSCNAAAAEMYGIDLPSIAGKTASQGGAPREVTAAWAARYEECRHTGKPVSAEYARRDARGQVRWLLATASYLGNGPSGHPRFAYNILDLTARKQAEEALRLSEEKFAKAFATNPAAVTITRLEDGLIVDVNETWQAMTGYRREEAIGRFSKDLHMWPAAEDRARCVRELREKGSLHGWEQTLLRKSGDSYAALFSAVILTIAGKEVVMSAWLDISERKRAEETMRKSEEQFRALANAIPQLCWMADADGSIFWYNQRWYRYTGATPEQMAGWGWQSVHDPQALPKVLERWKSSISTGEPFDMVFPLRGADGVFRPFLTRIMPVRDEHGKVVRWFGTNTDITEQRRVEDALRESSTKLEAALASMTDAVFISDAEGRFIHLNDSFATFYRFPNREACRRTISEYPAILDVFLPDGSLAPLEQWAVPRALRGEAVTSAEYTLRRKDTGETWIGSFSFAPIRDHNGLIAGSVVVARDVTDRKRREEEIRRLNTELEQRVRDRTAQLQASNKELEAFAYSVSHDLRAPLRGIDGWSLALVEDYSSQLEPRALRYLDRVRSETQRMGNLIDDLLQLSRITRAEMHRDAVNLSLAAESIAERLRESHPQRCLDFAIRPGLTAFGDRRLLEVALTNLLHNAVKFTGPREHARIEFGAMERDGNAAFVVRDNGVGFDMSYAGTLFGAFQRLHNDSEFPGTGIGLATVQRVIHRHGGKVWAEAEPDRGATFYFTLGSEK